MATTKKNITIGNFQYTLEIENYLNAPDEQDLEEEKRNEEAAEEEEYENHLAVQFGANFRLNCRNTQRKENKLGILQFVQSAVILSENCIGDFDPKLSSERCYPNPKFTNICIDRIIPGGKKRPHSLLECLYGSDDQSIADDAVYGICRGKKKTIQNKDSCDVYDTPKEIYPLRDPWIKTKPYTIQFWHFPVEIDDNDKCCLHPEGISWKLILKQEVSGFVIDEIEIQKADLEKEIQFKEKFAPYISDNTYLLLKL